MIDWLRTGLESPQNSKNYMTEEKVKAGLTIITNDRSNPLLKVVILGENYGFDEAGRGLYKRVEINGLGEDNPTLDFRPSSLEEVLPYLASGQRKIANTMERALVRTEILGEKAKSFQDRLYLLGNDVLNLHGNLPQSIKKKYDVK